MTSRTLLLRLSLLLALSYTGRVTMFAAGDSESKLGTPITSLPYTISAPGVYSVDSELSTTIQGGGAITVSADNVTLELNGHSISNTNTSNTAIGVYATDHKNITVHNGATRGFLIGVALSSSVTNGSLSYGNRVEQIAVSGATWYGISVYGNGNIVRKCQVTTTGGSTVGDGNGYGILAEAGSGNRILANDVTGVQASNSSHVAYGICVAQSTDTFVEGNQVSQAQYGIYFDGGSSGKYRSNLVGPSVTNPFSGGADAYANGIVGDENGNGIADSWELQYFGNLIHMDPFEDYDGDGLSNLQEYHQSTNPTDYYNGVAPGLQIVSGNRQFNISQGTLAQPLVTSVTAGGTNAVASDAPVTYTVTSGGATLASSSTGPWAQTCAVRTDTFGHATVYCQLGPQRPGIQVAVQVNAGNAAPAIFHELAPFVAAGLTHTLALDSNGAVWSWGSNQYGQLGNGTQGDRSFADQVSSLNGGMVAIAAGSYHSLAVRGSDGSVWAWGYNQYGQLGNNSTTQSLVPVQVLTQGASSLVPLTGIIAVAAGTSHSLALRSDGSVWAWGYNGDGELGNGTTTNQSVAVQVTGTGGSGTPGYIVAIAAGNGHSVAIQSIGAVYTWGANNSGQLGNGSNSSMSSPVQVKGLGGTGYLTNIISVAAGAGGYHTLALRSDGALFAWGVNGDGQLGINSEGGSSSSPVQVVGIGTPHSHPTTASLGNLGGVVGIAAGRNHSLAVLSNGTECAWGLNTSDQLGTNTTGDTSGDSDYPEAVVSSSSSGTLNGIASVGAGGDHSVAVAMNGTIYGWGTNTFGEAGNSNAVSPQPSPVGVVGLNFATQTARPAFVPEGGSYQAGQMVTVTCATPGAMIYYTLDDSEPTTTSLSASSGSVVNVSATAILRAKAFVNGGKPSVSKSALYQIGYTRAAAGQYHTLAVDNSGYVWAWGSNSNGQLGNNLSGTGGGAPGRVASPNGTGFLIGIVAVATGNNHSLALKNDGTVWAWGDNTYGELGDNTTVQRLMPVQVQAQASGTTAQLTGVTAIAAGSRHCLALRNDGSVWAWGENGYGKLGNNTTTNQSVAVQVLGPGGSGTLGNMVAIAAGDSHSVALKSDGTVWAWGASNGQLGNGTNSSPVYTPSEVSNIYGVVAIASGPRAYHTLAICGDGALFAWGNNGDGQLGINSEGSAPAYPVQVVGIGVPHSTPSTTNLGFLGNVLAIAAGQEHSLAVLSNGEVCAWGLNTSGQLGTNTTGDTSGDSDYPELVVSTSGTSGSTLNGIASVSAGGDHSVGVMAYQGVPIFFGWGDDSYGEVEGAIPASGPGQVGVTTRQFPTLVHVDADADEDGLSDWQEYLHGTNPLNRDSNGDGILDGVALAAGLDPLAPLPTLPPPNPNDHTPPQITITFPVVGITQM